MTSQRKADGDGSISRLRNGRYWARGPLEADGRTRKPLGTFATREEAVAVLATALAMRGSARAAHEALTFRRFGRAVLDQREADGYKSVKDERRRFEFHLAECSLADLSVSGDAIGPQHIADLARQLMTKHAADKRGRRLIDRNTVMRCMSLVSTIMTEAVARGHRAANPCAGVKVRHRKNEAKNKQKWTALSPDEQRAIAACEKIPAPERIMMRFCWGSGIREGEFSNLFLDDLHVEPNEPEPHLIVRWGGYEGGQLTTPKSGKTRKVHLFGDALVAAREWLAIRSSYLQLPTGSRDCGRVFPTVRGSVRQEGKPLGNGWKDPKTRKWVDRFKYFCELAGVRPRPYLHWHALRHTCASSLIQGHWGRRWTLEEIRDHLGHSSIVVTQMYAHLADDTMRDAARATCGLVGYAVVTGAVEGDPSVAAISNDPEGVGRAGHDPATYGLKEASGSQHLQLVSSLGHPENAPSSPGNSELARKLLQLVQDGNVQGALAVAVSLAAASVSAAQREARPVIPSRRCD